MDSAKQPMRVASDNPHFDSMIHALPEAMADLMRAFLRDRSMEARTKTRMRIKALLDLASVDTEYPDVPKDLETKADEPADPGVGIQVPYPPIVMRHQATIAIPGADHVGTPPAIAPAGETR